MLSQSFWYSTNADVQFNTTTIMSASTKSLPSEAQIDIIEESESGHFIEPAKEKRVLRKIDLFVMPAMVVVFISSVSCINRWTSIDKAW
jgi:hypothetical protein